MYPFIRDLPWVELSAAFCLHAYHHASITNSIWKLLSDVETWHSAVFLPLVTTGFLFILILPRCSFPWISLNREGVQHPSESSKDGNEPRPLLFPCQTTHTRLFPQKHSFSYSYLLVGVPVGWRGGANSFLSADLQSGIVDGAHESKAWFHVSAKDHLERGQHVNGLRGKLDDFLQAQQQDPSDYPLAYLVTAPAFLGYSFNPVSFWYLYDIRNELIAMILEVNNTFDERRMYFMEQSRCNVNERITQKSSNPSQVKPFTSSWSKDFHVSPFNSRKGTYSLKAQNLFSSEFQHTTLIANTITLLSSKNHAKLVASVTSTASSIDPYRLGGFEKLHFIITWASIGFITFPRILYQAAKLFFGRKLHVWYRPEVAATSIGRQASGVEKTIALLYLDWFRSVVKCSPLPLSVRYDSTVFGQPNEYLLESEAASTNEARPEPILFKPTTPLFSSKLALANDTYKFVLSCLDCTDPLQSIIFTERPSDLRRIFSKGDKSTKPILAGPRSAMIQKLMNHFRWSLIRLLRGLRVSELDDYAMNQADVVLSFQYQIATLKILFAYQFAFGCVEIITVLGWCIRIWLLRQGIEAITMLLPI